MITTGRYVSCTYDFSRDDPFGSAIVIVRCIHRGCGRAFNLRLTKHLSTSSKIDLQHNIMQVTQEIKRRGWYYYMPSSSGEMLVACDFHFDDLTDPYRSYATDLLKRTLPYVNLAKKPAQLSVPAVSKDVHTVVNELIKWTPTVPVRKAQGWARGYNWTWYRAMVRYERVS